MNSLRVFIGYDSEEPVAYSVLAFSIMRHAKTPISITPLKLGQLPMTRKRADYQSTEFSFSRFLVPYLCNYEGTAIFMDSDMLCKADLSEIEVDPYKAVSVVKHAYTPKDEEKFLGHRQSVYEKKNWSSFMYFNNAMCKTLTPKVVNDASGLYLHQFKWLQDDSLIGEIPNQWNYLVGEGNQCNFEDAKVLHYTLGTPCFRKYKDCLGSKDWYETQDQMLYYNRFGEGLEREKSEIRASQG